MTTDRILPLSELLLGAAYADKELKDQEKDEVRSLLEGLGGELSSEVEQKIEQFDPSKFDVRQSATAFKGDSEEERKKLLYLVAAVNEADDEIDFDEDEYLRTLADALALPKSALEGLTVEIETEEQDRMLVVRVRDSGIGIAAENITKIYDPFFTTKSVGQGTGLGLAVSYGIVQEHSGRIFVESSPGQGTTFTIKIPSRHRRMLVASD